MCNEDNENLSLSKELKESRDPKARWFQNSRSRGLACTHYANFIHTTSDRKPFLRDLAALGGAAKDDFVAHYVLVRYMQS